MFVESRGIGLTPLSHLLPGLDEFLNVPGAREIPRTDPAGEMSAPVEVLDGCPAHDLQACPWVIEFLKGKDLFELGTAGHNPGIYHLRYLFASVIN
jgi:hypothetical protein